MLKSIFILFLSYYNIVYGQYSFVAIEDSIILSNQNSKIFRIDELNKQDINSLGLQMRDEDNLNLDSLSLIIHARNIQNRKAMHNVVHSSEIKQREKYESYVFQIFPIIKENGDKGYLVFIMLKDIFPKWQFSPYFIRDGGNNYNVFGLF
ncbi:MAG: hypothetical protein PHQ74_05650 [Crocinitomicaceae bacterium]|nr:hypothetical protein [Crocinitomicaceae bacterium]